MITEPTTSVVTGAARGIGRAIAEQLVARGHRVVVTDIDGEGAARTAAEIGAAEGLGQDVREPQSHRDVAAAAARHGALTSWFNNAGVGFDGRLADQSEDEIRTLVEVNLLGVVWGTRAAIDAFGDAGGDIVNTGSLSAFGPVPGLSAYAATKAGVVSLAMSVNLETPSNVRVHAICPDGVKTELLATAGLGAQLVHSGGRILTVQEVAEEAVGLVGSHRVVRTIPRWRAALARTSALMPSQAGPGVALMARQGQRRLKRG